MHARKRSGAMHTAACSRGPRAALRLPPPARAYRATPGAVGAVSRGAGQRAPAHRRAWHERGHGQARRRCSCWPLLRCRATGGGCGGAGGGGGGGWWRCMGHVARGVRVRRVQQRCQLRGQVHAAQHRLQRLRQRHQHLILGRACAGWCGAARSHGRATLLLAGAGGACVGAHVRVGRGRRYGLAHTCTARWCARHSGGASRTQGQ